MSSRSSQPANSTLQPFRLLDLPRELLIAIVRSNRTRRGEMEEGMILYSGEWDGKRYKVLRDLCLTHRDILPFAQEELFKMLDIGLDQKRMDMLNRSIASSELCKEYAGRTESIHVNDADKLMESGAFNPRELYTDTMKFSFLNQFQNLRRIVLHDAQFDEALVLPNLESCSISQRSWTETDTRAALTSVNLPNLRRLNLSHHGAVGSFGQLYDSVIPQLDHLHPYCHYAADLEHLLLLSTTLQSLRCNYDGSEHEGLAKVIDQIRRINVKDLRFFQRSKSDSSDNWEKDFDSIEKFKKAVECKDGLKQVGLDFTFKYYQRPSEDVCNRAFGSWKRIKDEFKSICVKKGIEVVAFDCCFRYDQEVLWEDKVM